MTQHSVVYWIVVGVWTENPKVEIVRTSQNASSDLGVQRCGRAGPQVLQPQTNSWVSGPTASYANQRRGMSGTTRAEKDHGVVPGCHKLLRSRASDETVRTSERCTPRMSLSCVL